MRRPRAALSRVRIGAAPQAPAAAPSPPPAPVDADGRGPVQEPADARTGSAWPGRLLVGAALFALGIVGFYLRFRHNGYGLPFVYNYDEASHFTNRAVAMFGSDFDPGYYQNPSGFTYL